jgi:hypothetical protein
MRTMRPWSRAALDSVNLNDYVGESSFATDVYRRFEVQPVFRVSILFN